MAVVALAALPGLLTLYLSFNSGGFFVGAPGLVATVLGVLLVLRITLAEHPVAGITRPLAVAAGGLGLFAAWTLMSAFWSDAPARAIVEFDRAVMYWLLLLLLAAVPWTPSRLMWAVRGVALAIVVVATAAFVSRVLPELLPTSSPVENARLSYPLSYWNALGIFCALGLVLCAHLSSNRREPLGSRLIAAGALPIVAGALFFSFSRGGLVAAIVGLIVYAAIARPRALPGALLAGIPPVAVTLVAAYRADLLASDHPESAAAVAQGHEVALVAAACVVAAVLLRLALLRLDAVLERAVAPRLRFRAGSVVGIAGAVVVVTVGAAIALGGAGWAADRYDDLASNEASESGDLRSRFSSADNNGRVEQWQVAIDAFREQPTIGSGAATFGQIWARERDGTMKVEDAHSLYLETLAELGLVGLALLLTPLAILLVGTARRARGPSRGLYAAIFACLLMWVVHAGIDWDWEMPAVTVGVLALAAMALTVDGGAPWLSRLGRMPRVALSIGCLALVVLPGLMAISQDRLNASVAAFKRDDCARAIETALDAAEAVRVRPEPYALLGYCDARLGHDALAVEMLEAAVARDPGDWQLHYGLALVQARAGIDPRPAARTALRLNPNELLARDAVDLFRGSDPRVWKRRARAAPLPIL